MVLKQTTIIYGDYHDILFKYAQKDDFVFLDPPYIPISKSSDFKRYTKDQFGEDDQRRLAEDIHSLHKKGCKQLLSSINSIFSHLLLREKS